MHLNRIDEMITAAGLGIELSEKQVSNTLRAQFPITVDAIIIMPNPDYKAGQNSNIAIPVINRLNEPYLNLPCLPGGFVEPNERLRDAVEREALEETGMVVKARACLDVYDEVDRDPRGRCVSVAYVCEWISGAPKAGDDAKSISLFTDFEHIEEIEFGFDHRSMIIAALNHMMERTNMGMAMQHIQNLEQQVALMTAGVQAQQNNPGNIVVARRM